MKIQRLAGKIVLNNEENCYQYVLNALIFNITGKLVPGPDSQGSLDSIVKHSIFKSEEDLLKEFDSLSESTTGTKIIIYNLKR